MPTGRNADHRKWQHVAAMLHGRHTAITWQCDMDVNPVVRHSEPVKKNRASDFYMQIMSKGTITPAPGKYNYAVGLGRQNEIVSEI